MLIQNVTLRFSYTVLQLARCQTQTAFLFATLRAIFVKSFTSHTHIRIPQPQYAPSYYQQFSARTRQQQLQVRKQWQWSQHSDERDSLQSTSTEENKKQDKKKGNTTATKDRWTEDQVKYLADLWEANILRLESQGFKKSVDRNSTSSMKCQHFGLVKQNASAMARGQQSNCQKTNFSQSLWSLLWAI